MRLALLALAVLAAAAAPDWTVHLRRAGPVRFGMTVAQAGQAAGVDFERIEEVRNGGCSHVAPGGDWDAPVHFMTWDDRVVRVSVSGPGVTTRSGVGVGSPAADVYRAYPGRIVATPHAYVDGEYLTFVPRDAADRDYRVVFETSADTVTGFRAGLAEATMLVEGCS